MDRRSQVAFAAPTAALLTGRIGLEDSQELAMKHVINPYFSLDARPLHASQQKELSSLFAQIG
ncbi:hypothetical protein [Collimonas sp. OK242]|jgi:hypothetical protein|uniref:hypothetical protein n=1 Tax=Collimonas sp. OK242 TaxID=1798195 RepID=UPI000B8444F7|nr:hypothetical protein [Collimonas sp. OK242]